MIDLESKYPTELDDEANLRTVKDSLKAVLGHDYRPGDRSIIAEGDISRFPSSGLITLVDPCGSLKQKAISFYYKNKTDSEFLDLQMLPNCIDSFKPRKLTLITQQVMAEDHNNLKDAIIAIQKFLGAEHLADSEPFGSTIFGRINFLHKLIFVPKAWFEATRTVGLVPLTVDFVSKSSGTNGPVGEVTFEWDFGDGSTDINTTPEISHTYDTPGVYAVSLKVSNQYGYDTIKLEDMIKVRVGAPKEAEIRFLPQSNQMVYGSSNQIRTTPNQIIKIEVANDPPKLGYTSAGEKLNPMTGMPYDPIISYTWNLSDDLLHKNSKSTRASYSIGGLHDIVLRTDTQHGSYRITTVKNIIDVIENVNMWLWLKPSPKTIQCYEFNLLSETFKARSNTILPIKIDDSFIDPKYERMKSEFLRNNGSMKTTEESSGSNGNCLLFWASQQDKVEFLQYNPFSDVYKTPRSSIDRHWNWINLSFSNMLHFILGTTGEKAQPSLSPTNQTRTTLETIGFNESNSKMETFHYKNGAIELTRNNVQFDNEGKAICGHFSVYRSVCKEQIGYLMRSINVDESFRLVNFYKTEGTFIEPFINLTKLVDLPDLSVKDGQLVALSEGIYLFSSSGDTYLYNDNSGVWETKEPNNAIRSVIEETDCSLLGTGDSEETAYLSYDYSPNAFFKYNELDSTFANITERPLGEQWLTTIF